MPIPRIYLPIRYRLLAGVVLIGVVAMSVVVFQVTRNLADVASGEIERRVYERIAEHRSLLLHGLLTEDYVTLETISDSLAQQDGFHTVVIRDRYGVIRGSAAHKPGDAPASTDMRTFVEPVTAGGVRYGEVETAVSLRHVHPVIESARRQVVYASGVGLLLSSLFIYALVFVGTRVFGRLREATAEIRGGHYGVQVDYRSRNELGDLVRAFNAMSVRLAQFERWRKQDERTLREMIVAFPGLGMVLNRQLQPELVNPAAATILGVDRETLVSGSIGLRDFVVADDRPAFDASIEQIKQGIEGDVTIRIQQPSSDVLWLRCLVRRTVDDVGQTHKLCLVGVDVTLQMAASQLPGDSPALQLAILSSSDQAVLTIDSGGTVVYGNPAASQLFDMQESGVVGTPIQRLLPSVFSDPVSAPLRPREAFLGGQFVESLGRRRDTNLFPVEVHIQRLDGDQRSSYLLAVRDLTERRRSQQSAQSSQQRLQFLLNSTEEAIVSFDLSGRIDLFNAAASKLFGYGREMLENVAIDEVLPLPHGYADYGQFVALLMGAPVFECYGQHRNGTRLALRVRCRAHVAQGRQTYTLFMVPAMAASGTFQQDVVVQRDGLTGLYSRSYFIDHIKAYLDRPEGIVTPQNCLIMLGIDRFESLSEDGETPLAVLRSVAAMLLGVVPRGHLVARFGESEFAVFLFATPFLKGFQLAERARAQLAATPVKVGRGYVDVRGTLSILTYPHESVTPEAALVLMRGRLVTAQRSGGNIVVPADRRAADENQMPAIRGSRPPDLSQESAYVLYQQPVVNIGREAVEYREALFRVFDGEDLVTGDGIFVTTLSDERRVHVDTWVQNQVLDYLQERERGATNERMAVKLSRASIYSGVVLDRLQAEIRRRGIEKGRLLISIAADLVTADYPYLRMMCTALKSCGCGIVLESYRPDVIPAAYLHDLPFDYLKLHPALSVPLHDPVESAGLRSAIRYVSGLGALVVAAFIEDDAMISPLREMGIDLFQGLHISPPTAVSGTALPVCRRT